MEELSQTSQPHPGDILVIAKHRMADPEPYKVVVAMSAGYAASLCKGFCQPTGLAARRAISQRVANNIASIAPKCCRQGIISKDALSYLLNWSAGQWAKQSRPTSYSYLTHRSPLPFQVPNVDPCWEPARRLKHIDLTVPNQDEVDDSSSDNDAEVQLVPA